MEFPLMKKQSVLISHTRQNEINRLSRLTLQIAYRHNFHVYLRYGWTSIPTFLFAVQTQQIQENSLRRTWSISFYIRKRRSHFIFSFVSFSKHSWQNWMLFNAMVNVVLFRRAIAFMFYFVRNYALLCFVLTFSQKTQMIL